MNVVCAGNDPYAPLVSQFFHREFPQKLCADHADFLDLITAELLGTKQTRLGPKPSPEVLVEIRKVIRHYTERQLPIPFMVPWGSEKPDGSSVDVAELMALKQLHDVNERVRRRYLPGMHMRVRVEDASAPHLFVDDPAKARRDAAVYTDSLVKLNKILGFGDCIEIVPESTIVTEEQFSAKADEFLPTFERAIQLMDAPPFGSESDVQEAQAMLAALGWCGGIHADTRAHYHDRFQKLYPHKTPNERRAVMARYFAGAHARKVLRARGDLPAWEGRYADISFVPLIPGTSNYFGRRLFYRTLPLDQSSVHIAPWRAKGYLQISDENDVCVKLASFSALPVDLRKLNVRMSDGVDEVFVQADYQLV